MKTINDIHQNNFMSTSQNDQQKEIPAIVDMHAHNPFDFDQPFDESKYKDAISSMVEKTNKLYEKIDRLRLRLEELEVSDTEGQLDLLRQYISRTILASEEETGWNAIALRLLLDRKKAHKKIDKMRVEPKRNEVEEMESIRTILRRGKRRA